MKVLFAKLIFLGPPERGKTLTRLRLENPILNMESNPKYSNNPSTPLAKIATYVISDLTRTAALLSNKGWKPLTGENEELTLLLQLLFKIQEELQAEEIQTVSGVPDDMENNVRGNQPLGAAADLGPKISEIFDIFDESIATSTWDELAGQLENLCLLYNMKDTGGQPELMDMLPALIIGPALYLLFVRYGDDLDATYKVSLRGITNCKIPDRISSCTVRQNLVSALSSIFSMQSYSNLQKVECESSLYRDLLKASPETVVYIIGTHKDKVSPEQRVEFDIKVQKIMKDTAFENIVHFASKDGFESDDPKEKMPQDKERLIYPIDNNRGTSNEIKGLQKFIQRALNKFPRPEIPARWLPFAMFLRFTKDKYVSIQACYQLGKECRMDEEETKVALWFFHHYTGIIFYFPNVPQLANIVISDTQVVFDSISRLIFENGVDLRHAGDKLRKVGQISFADIKSVSGDVLPPEQMEALFRHFRIIAPLGKALVKEKFVDENPAQLYFMPCVLPKCSDKELDQLIHEVLTKVSQRYHSISHFPIFQKLLLKFENVYRMKLLFSSEFVPIGLFPSMIASLIGQGSEVSKTVLHIYIVRNILIIIIVENYKIQ